VFNPHDKRRTETGSMSGDNGPLQKLTDQQVSARLAAYNPGGSLDRDLEMLSENAADLIAEETRAQFGPQHADRYAAVYESNVDSAWVQGIAEYGREIYREKTSVPVYIAARTQTAGRILGRMADRFSDDDDKRQECVGAF